MPKVFTPPNLPKVRPSPLHVEPEETAKIQPTPASALSAWFDDEGRGLPWVDRKHAQQYAAACVAHGVPFTRDDTTLGAPSEWRAWAQGV